MFELTKKIRIKKIVQKQLVIFL